MSQDPDQDLIQRYDRDALAYRELWAPLLRRAGGRLLREVAAAGVRRILDVGAGTGALFEEWAATFPNTSIVGIDRSAGMLALAPARMPRALADARQLPIRDGSVDLVAMVFMLFHLPEPAAGLREARRVLRAGGRVATVTWGSDLTSAAHAAWTECLDRHGATPVDPAMSARHESVDTPDKMEALLRATGFASVRAWQEELIQVLNTDDLIGLKTRMGSERPRYDSLAPADQAACVAGARRAIAALGEERIEARGHIVFAVAG